VVVMRRLLAHVRQLRRWFLTQVLIYQRQDRGFP
jgi:hypothetical protein